MTAKRKWSAPAWALRHGRSPATTLRSDRNFDSRGATVRPPQPDVSAWEEIEGLSRIAFAECVRVVPRAHTPCALRKSLWVWSSAHWVSSHATYFVFSKKKDGREGLLVLLHPYRSYCCAHDMLVFKESASAPTHAGADVRAAQARAGGEQPPRQRPVLRSAPGPAQGLEDMSAVSPSTLTRARRCSSLLEAAFARGEAGGPVLAPNGRTEETRRLSHRSTGTRDP